MDKTKYIGDPRDAPTSGGLDQEGVTSMVVSNVPPRRGAAQIFGGIDKFVRVAVVVDGLMVPRTSVLLMAHRSPRWT